MKKRILIIAVIISTGILMSGVSFASSPEGTASKNDKTEAGINNVQEPGKTIHLTKKSFLEKVMNYEKNPTEWVYEGDKPCIIDFYADWCGPCKQAAPVLEELAKEYEGEIYVYKINTDKEKELASAFGIRGIPAFLWVPMEGKPQMSSGVARSQADTKKMFKEMIDKVLLNQAKSN